MTTFVFVHGAWYGSWCWKRVRALLGQCGHEVFTPTLTGLGERKHLLAAGVDLRTHIADVENLILWEELDSVVLCGHSYGGCVLSGVADRIPDRIRSLVYVDAFVLENGECLFDTLPPDFRELQLEQSMTLGDEWLIPPIPARAFQVNEADRDWVDRQCTMQPLASFQQPLRLTGAGEAVRDVRYIHATGWGPSPFGMHRERAAARGWSIFTIDCGHDVMIDRPRELAAELLNAGTGGQR